MNHHQLEYFVTVADNITFLEASEILNISQSSLSKHIIKLEKELDVKLFDRSKRSAVLTEAGRAFYEEARLMLEAYGKMKARLKPFTEGCKGAVLLGTLPILTQYGLTPVLKQFREDYPGIQLSIDEVEDEHLMYGLRHGSYDLAITRAELLKDNVYKSRLLTDDELVALLPLSHPLADRDLLDIRLLEHEKFIFMHKYISIYQLCIDACLAGGFQPRVIRTARMESILSAVAAGEGISLLCRKNLRIFNCSGIAALPLAPPVRTCVVLARPAKEKTSESVKIFMDYIQKNYRIED